MRPNRARAALVISSVAESLARSVWMVSRLSALPWLMGACRKGLERLTIAIDPGDPDARRQQALRHCPCRLPPAAPVTIATRWISLIAWFPPAFAGLHPTSNLEGERAGDGAWKQSKKLTALSRGSGWTAGFSVGSECERLGCSIGRT